MTEAERAGPELPAPIGSPVSPSEERVTHALIGGLVASLIGGAIWAGIVIVATLEIGWAAWGVGALVGLAMARLTPTRGHAIATLAALIAAIGLVAGKALIVAFGTPSAITKDIKADSAWMAQATLHELRTKSALPGPIQQKLDALSFSDTLPDALWAEMLTAGATHAATLGEPDRDRIAAAYASVLIERMGFMGLLQSQSGPWDLLWFGLAITTAWRMMARKRGDAT
jgi:hypothetical protein